MKVRSLYDCFLARYPVPPDEYVECQAGHNLSKVVHKRQVDRNDRLIFKECQLCQDFVPFDIEYNKAEK